MIYLFSGKTGSGKTFLMVKEAYKRWLKGDDIYTNTILNFDPKGIKEGKNYFDNKKIFKLREKFFFIIKVYVYSFLRIKRLRVLRRGNIYYFEDINEILHCKNGVILFDEANVLFSSRNWDKLSDEFVYKLQKHRHHNLDLYCTTQNIRSIDVVYRRLVQYWVDIKPLFKLGKRICYIGLFYKDIKDIDGLEDQPDEAKTYTKRRWIFSINIFSKRLYNTIYDIGYRRCRLIWAYSIDLVSKKKSLKAIIQPKEKDLKSVFRYS